MKNWKHVLGFGLGFGLMALFLWNTDLPRFWAALRGASPGFIALAVLLTCMSFVLRAVRWHYLVRPIKPARFGSLFEGIVVGFTVSNILPGKLGEVVRPYMVARRDGHKTSALFATVVVDRILDGLTILLLFGVYLVAGISPESLTPAMQEHVGTLKAAGLSTLAGLLGVLVCLWALRFRTAGFLWLLGVALRPLPQRWRDKIVEAAAHFALGLMVLSDAGAIAWATFWSVVIWLEIGVSHYFVIRSFGIQLPFMATFFLLALMAIGVAIPTPGGMGGLQWACKLGLSLTAFPLPEEPVLDAASMAVWGNAFLPVTLIGLVYLWREGLSLGKIEEMKPPDEP